MESNEIRKFHCCQKHCQHVDILIFKTEKRVALWNNVGWDRPSLKQIIVKLTGISFGNEAVYRERQTEITKYKTIL